MPDLFAGRLRRVLKKSESPPQVEATSVHASSSDDIPEEPSSLALRIQSLIDSLPIPTIPTHINNPKPPQRDQDGKPIPPAAPLKDSRLVAILNSATIMNGSRAGRPSIWSVLEGLGAPKHEENTVADMPQERSDEISDIFSESSSVMVYSPLLPTRDSLVELASSEVIPEEGLVDEHEQVPELPIPGWSWANILPSLTSWFPQAPSVPLTDEDGRPLTPRTHERRLRVQATRVWVPSKDKLSIQTMWWGYRMFLPPPVLDILDDKQLEAAKRAAMITTALTWFFNNLPVSSFPLAIRPTLLLLQRLAPYLGYIGTFISWSWSAIKGYDKGFGVILSATWLLPVALIPGTWNERDWPITPPTTTVPLPRESEPPTASPAPVPTPPPAPISGPPSQLPPSPSVPIPPPQTLPSDLPPKTSPVSAPQPSVPIASPIDSFPTVSLDAPSSPSLSPSVSTTAASPPTPKRIRTSLASLVAKSPIIRAHGMSKTKSNASSTSSKSKTSPPLPSPNTAPSPSLPTVGELVPSPPANPNDLRLLQSPIIPCSPLPPEEPVLLPSGLLASSTTGGKEGRKWRKKGFLKAR